MSYQDLQNRQKILREFPNEAIFAIRVLLEQLVLGWDVPVERQLEEIARNFSISLEAVKTYFEWFQQDKPESITVHYMEVIPDTETNHFVYTLDGTQGPLGSVVVLSVTERGAVYYPTFVYLSHFDEMQERMLEALLLIRQLNTSVEEVFKKGCVKF